MRRTKGALTAVPANDKQQEPMPKKYSATGHRCARGEPCDADRIHEPEQISPVIFAATELCTWHFDHFAPRIGLKLKPKKH